LEATGRPAKSTGALIEKLHRETIRLTQVQDIAGCRVIVTDVAEQERVVDSLRAVFSEASVADRRVNPSYGYRAVHVIVEIDGVQVEIQVRTSLQHLWAELSEKFSDVVDPSIKCGQGPAEVRELLATSSELIVDLERQEATLAREAREVFDLASEQMSSSEADRLRKVERQFREAQKVNSDSKGRLVGILTKGIVAAQKMEKREL
jgi:ppGpp synthetase/RelA/SpoT-type nucleotidyltranferase